MDVQNEIIKAIGVIVDKKVEDLSISKDIPTVVKSVKDNKYEVLINGQTYWVLNGVGMVFAPNSLVWVRNPGNMANAYICANRSILTDTERYATIGEVTNIVESELSQKEFVTSTQATAIANSVVDDKISTLKVVTTSTDTSYEPLD